jgi:4-amino-4-deoxy-L-arabinose transferase-like glycosyltransferase
MLAVGEPVLGGATATVRVLGLVLTLVTLLIVYGVGARLIGRPRAAVAVLIVAGE